MTNPITTYLSPAAQSAEITRKVRRLDTLLADAAQGLSIAMTALEEAAEQLPHEYALVMAVEGLKIADANMTRLIFSRQK